LLTLIAFVVAVVMFIRWFRHAYANLPALGATNLRFQTWWTIGSWFIPIINLFRPKQIANDIWRASDPNWRLDQEPHWEGAHVPALFQWWWGFYLVGTWLENISFRAELAANDLAGYRNAAAVTMAVNAFEASSSSPQTTRSLWRLINCAMPKRTTAWSSTNNTRLRVSLAGGGGCRCLDGVCFGGAMS